MDRLPSRLNLSARVLEINDIGWPFCSARVESLSHVLFSCDVAVDIWRNARIWIDIQLPILESWIDWETWFQRWNASPKMKGRMYVITAALSWTLWRFRSAFIFDPGKMKKQELFDLIRLYSFNWCTIRGKDLLVGLIGSLSLCKLVVLLPSLVSR
ncbi:uncharacterized protein [Rutidosis leptorrhynchoides]|uniref:uncharacterized protein n=1 Tax=Rutidosis leptorrhynchoides TaxID=125765 RepID=UPI003A99F2BC